MMREARADHGGPIALGCDMPCPPRLLPRTVLLLAVLGGPGSGEEIQDRSADTMARLIAAYPDFLDRVEGNDLVWRDGSRMPIEDGKGPKDLEAMLHDPDIGDMFAMPYPVGRKGIPPAIDVDPGRVRYAPLFDKIYGDCEKGEVTRNLASVTWLPRKSGKTIRFNKVNGAAAALQKVSNELDALPDALTAYLQPLQGTYNCRSIAGTDRASAHSHGIAIDIAAAHTHYWRWEKPQADGRIAFRNEVPWDIVLVFEKHGFIWGGKWYHFDTMHFEYRPEIVSAGQEPQGERP